MEGLSHLERLRARWSLRGLLHGLQAHLCLGVHLCLQLRLLGHVRLQLHLQSFHHRGATA
jgi:hypothetical protein